MRDLFSTLLDLLSAPPVPQAERACSAHHLLGAVWEDFDLGTGLGDGHGDLVIDEGINPATGLLMAGGLDIAGNPYGFDGSSLSHTAALDPVHDPLEGSDSMGGDPFCGGDMFSSHDACGSSFFGSNWD